MKDDRLEVEFSREKTSRSPGGRSSRGAGRRRSRARERAFTRAGSSDRSPGVPAGARAERGERALGVAPVLFLGVFRWLAELLASALEVPGVRVGLLAVVIGGAFYASRLAGLLQVAGAWLRMAAVIGAVVGLAIVLGMATGAVSVDVAAAWDMVAGLLEVLH